jgi:hypothetical protein
MIGRNPAYTDATGRYFVFGHLFDLQTQRDLTAERLEAQQRVAFRRVAACPMRSRRFAARANGCWPSSPIPTVRTASGSKTSSRS